MTASELEQKGIIELREMIRTDKANNPRNLSGWLISTMDRAECVEYMVNGTLPSADKTPGRKASIESGAVKFFAKGGDPVGGMSSAEVQGKVERETEREEKATPLPTTPPAPQTTTAAPGLDALMLALTAAVKAEVLSSLPPPPKQELDESAVRRIAGNVIADEISAIKTGAIEAAKTAAEKADSAITTALADIMRALATAPAPAKARASAALKKTTGKGTNVILDRLLSLCPIGDNPANHVLIVGPSGTGKTYQARNFANMHDWTCAPIGFHKYLEPHHISGSAAPNDDGAFSFVSGAFRDAFIAASEGKTACILLDEILRASAEMQESLLTILDPIPTSKGLVYRYRSGKPVKTGENGSTHWTQEVIECPVEKLTIVATANIGSNYGVFSVDEAFWKRFRVLRIERQGEDERQIIADACAHLDAGAIRGCIKMLDETRRAVKSGSLQYPACIRTLTRCAKQSETKAQLKEALRILATEELTGWTEDGAILQTHLESAKAIFSTVEIELAKDS
jgi:MoxR-like ATPase